MEEVPTNGEQESVLQGAETLLENDGEKTEFNNHNDTPEGRKEFVAPAIGMEFESYEDAYNYYNCYAREMGFQVQALGLKEIAGRSMVLCFVVAARVLKGLKM